MLTVRDLVLDDGTCYVPHELHDTDQDYKKDSAFENAIAEKVKMDPLYKDSEHKPFIGWVKLLGRKPIRALLIPGTREELDEYLDDEDKEYKSEMYWSRCPISDDNGKLKQCPLQIPNPDYGKVPGASKTIMNRCEFCQTYRQWKNKPKNTTLEGMAYNDEGEEVDTGDFGRPALSHGDMADRVRDIVLGVAMDKHSKYYDAIKAMLDYNLSVNKASERGGVSNSSFDKALKNGLCKDILKALENDPFVEIQKLLH